ncbi:DUF86 domain-containing protein [Pseudalkalibacillus hwajinpoensis]|uniref:DUF86 domain-containing protein n=1 Tax=Guptibacillus hwajinpoensis TaxID=208199 RepID=A0A4U1MDM5_9BACL|nr:DUF86 domain-containing protein [Pseudalkalibacillus hwajinpoensis]TKD69299.1 DUF86 domain-containing protein [Pseudalkalibacillus hwajinpoensis]
MYFVDRKKIEEHLVYLDNGVALFKKSTFQTPVEKLGLERLHHVFIESMIDVGNNLIDGFIMRDPGSYEDIIEILADEKVIPAENSKALKKIVLMRKPLMQSYVDIDHAAIEENVRQNIEAIESFSTYVRTYLNEELGAVSAFIPEDYK